MTRDDFDAQGFARDIHEIFVLLTLRDEGKHGYQIALDVEAESNGLVRFRHGTLYPILHRLEEGGLIQGSWADEGGRRRKVYGLTRRGTRHLAGESTRMTDLLSRLLSILASPGEAHA